jgi:hypothetical protein
MYVTQLLEPFHLGENDEVIKSRLPDTAGFRQGLSERKVIGVMRVLPHTGQKAPRESLFQGFHHVGWISSLGLGQQQMYVFGHNDVPDDNQVITTANLLEDVKEQIADAGIVQERTSLITTRGNEMGVTGAIVAMQAVRHGPAITQGSAF